jgi:hypothetical protein
MLVSYLTGSIYATYFGVEGFVLGFGSLHLLSAIMLFFTAFWLYYGMKKYFPEQKIGLLPMIAFVCIYPALLTFFWLAAAYKEACGPAKTW